MLKVAPPQCLIIESFIYISCCRKYIRMMNGLRPFAELCMDVCYADEVDFDAINGNGRWSRFEVVMKAERAERILS